MLKDPIEFTIQTTDQSVEKYVKERDNPQIVINHLENFVTLMSGNTILDLGCGHGRDCKYFEENGFTVVGVDLSEKMLDVARNQCSSSILLNMDIRKVGNVPWKFDGIWSCAVIHHIPSEYLEDLLSSLYEILNDNGVLFLTFKIDSSGYLFREDLGVEKFYQQYDTEEFMETLEKIGFEIVEYSIEQKKYEWFNIFLRK